MIDKLYRKNNSIFFERRYPEILNYLRNPQYSNKFISNKFGITMNAIILIRKRTGYRHYKGSSK